MTGIMTNAYDPLALTNAYVALGRHIAACPTCDSRHWSTCDTRAGLDAEATREEAAHQRRQQALDRLGDAFAALPTEVVERAVLAALRELTAASRHRAAWPGPYSPAVLDPWQQVYECDLAIEQREP